jgi:tRNA 2-thiouridine synthesizing protein A
MTTQPIPAADITVDGTGLLCVTLLLRLRKRIDGAAPGTGVHVITTDPAAPLDLPAWCHMTGHAYLGPVRGTEQPTYAIQLAADAREVHSAATHSAAGNDSHSRPEPGCKPRRVTRTLPAEERGC